MSRHDGSYKQIFSHASVIEDLLRGFIHEDWATEVDYGTLEKVNGSYVSEDLRERSDDVVWRVKFKDQWLYVYLLIEFQSRVDAWMALRMLVYVGLLYQDLIKTGVVGNGEALPPVFPMVIYNGEGRWTAVRDVSELIASVSGPLSAYQPKLKYWLLDEGRISESELPNNRNTVADIIRLENSSESVSMQAAMARLSQHLSAPEYDSLRRVLVVWIKRVVLRKLQPDENFTALNDLQEINNMLAERVEQWTTKWMQQGLEQGLHQGMQQGMQQGEQTLLHRQLCKRFGLLSEDIQQRLQNATTDQLELWAERILDAETLDAVFTEH